MDTCPAPECVRQTQVRYRRTRFLWQCLHYLRSLVLLAFAWRSHWRHAMGVYLVSFMVLFPFLTDILLAPLTRAKRYTTALDRLDAALAAYHGIPGAPVASLCNALQTARECLHLRPIRTAPQWIVDMRRGITQRLVAQWSPFAAAILVLFAARTAWKWSFTVCFVIALALVIWGLVRGARLLEARGLLTAAIARYRYESAATRADLDAAVEQANAMFATRTSLFS
jgi:hypothetical protein